MSPGIDRYVSGDVHQGKTTRVSRFGVDGIDLWLSNTEPAIDVSRETHHMTVGSYGCRSGQGSPWTGGTPLREKCADRSTDPTGLAIWTARNRALSEPGASNTIRF